MKLKKVLIIKIIHMANTKVTLTITIPEEIHKKLKRIVGLGKVSEFVSKAIEKDLLEKEGKIIADYNKRDKDKELKKEMEG
jgi:predicted CopG family antitoxin